MYFPTSSKKAFVGLTGICLTSVLLLNPKPTLADAAITPVANFDRYDPQYFMAFEPQTLYDVLENIPGTTNLLMELGQNSQGRGFGSSGDQVLINSKRVSGKENDLEKELNSIQARDVDYVELIRGTRSDLDVQSKGLVINVVLKKQIDSTLMWNVGAVDTAAMKPQTVGSLVFSSALGQMKYRLGYERGRYPTRLLMLDSYRTPSGALTDSYKRVRYNWYGEDLLTAKVEWPLSSVTQLQLSALVGKTFVDADYRISHNDWLVENRNDSKLVYDWQRDKWELSGDISHKINAKQDVKVLFISNYQESDDKLWQRVYDEQGIASPGYRLPRVYNGKENVLRLNWSYDLDLRHTLMSGVESAINSREEDLQFISESDQGYHSTELNDIKETRYEAFVNYNFAASSKLNIQSSLIYERSTLDVDTDFTLVTDVTQSGVSSTSRRFSYFKPRLNIRYDVSDIHQLRFNYERTVSQLDLKDFVPEFNREESRLEETNPYLQPEVRDEVSFSFERQWQDTQGSIVVTPYYHKITDLITEIPLTSYSGSGNIDEGKEFGLTFEASFGLEKLGLSQTQVSTSYTRRDSEMVNPFTHQKSKINDLSDEEWSVAINQKELLPGLSYQLTIKKQSPYTFARFDYQGRRFNDLSADAIVDYQISKQLKLRLKADRILSRKARYNRIRHEGSFVESNPLRLEQREYDRGTRYYLTLSGQF